MKFIITLLWSLLLGATLAYVLASMAGDPFNMTQTIAYAAVVFIATFVLDGILNVKTEQE